MMKITVTFTDGKRRVLKAPDQLAAIDARRAAYFLFDTGEVFKGMTDGNVDENGMFSLKADLSPTSGTQSIGLPFARLIGWAYVNPKRSKK